MNNRCCNCAKPTGEKSFCDDNCKAVFLQGQEDYKNAPKAGRVRHSDPDQLWNQERYLVAGNGFDTPYKPEGEK